jgi:hypothetical protein
MDINTVTNAIEDGSFDEDIERILQSLSIRRRILSQRTAADNLKKLTPGCIIVIAGNCKPKMLANQPVIYLGKEGLKLQVELKNTYSAKWRVGSVIRIPVTLIGEVIPQ